MKKWIGLFLFNISLISTVHAGWFDASEANKACRGVFYKQFMELHRQEARTPAGPEKEAMKSRLKEMKIAQAIIYAQTSKKRQVYDEFREWYGKRSDARNISLSDEDIENAVIGQCAAEVPGAALIVQALNLKAPAAPPAPSAPGDPEVASAPFSEALH
jgi:hypothetical protein